MRVSQANAALDELTTIVKPVAAINCLSVMNPADQQSEYQQSGQRERRLTSTVPWAFVFYCSRNRFPLRPFGFSVSAASWACATASTHEPTSAGILN